MKISKVSLKNCGFGGPIATFFLGHPVHVQKNHHMRFTQPFTASFFSPNLKCLTPYYPHIPPLNRGHVRTASTQATHLAATSKQLISTTAVTPAPTDVENTKKPPSTLIKNAATADVQINLQSQC